MKKLLRISRGPGLGIVLFFAGYKLQAQNAVIQGGATPVTYGVFSIKLDIDTRLVAANNLGVEHVRLTQYLSYWSGEKNSSIDYWKTRKKKIVLNINNDTTPSYFPKNLNDYKSKLQSFIDVYGDSTELAVIENEELNVKTALTGTNYHNGSMQDYINELSAAATICQQKGVPVTNGGITTEIIPSLKHYYDVNNKPDSALWLVTQMNGVSTDSSLWKRTDSLLNAYKTIPLTYVNLHWYEPMKDMNRITGVLQVVCNYITQQTGKKVITNETGVKTDSSFVTQLMQEWDKVRPAYCIFWDGIGANGGQPLTSETGSLLATGMAFRNYIAGGSACSKSIVVSPAGFITSCVGSNLTLTASAGFSKYKWSTGDTTQSISVKETGNYWVTSKQKNCISFSNTAQVLLNIPPPKPVITSNPAPPLNICPSKKVQLLSSNALTHSWNTGDTTKNIWVSNTGKYYVTVSDVNGCKSVSDTTNVNFQDCAAPSHLGVTGLLLNKVTLKWDAVPCALGYQLQYRVKGIIPWTSIQILNGTTTSKTLYSLTAAVYQWRILTYCRYVPDTLKSIYVNGPEFTILTALNIADAAAEKNNRTQAKIFPAPAKDFANVFVSNTANVLKITVADLYGKILWQKKNVTGSSVRIPVNGWASGVYIVTIDDKKNKQTLRLLKE